MCACIWECMHVRARFCPSTHERVCILRLVFWLNLGKDNKDGKRRKTTEGGGGEKKEKQGAKSACMRTFHLTDRHIHTCACAHARRATATHICQHTRICVNESWKQDSVKNILSRLMDTFLVISKEFLSCFIDPLFVYQTSLGALSKQHLGSNAAHFLPNSLEERRTCRQIKKKQNKTKKKTTSTIQSRLNNEISRQADIY